MPLPIRTMLTLQNDSSLRREEVWLKEAYGNIVSNLIESTITTTSSEFDPFVSSFMGIHSVNHDDKFQYQALLETTSYFWASKGGRGALLEKIIASLGDSYSSNGVTLSKVISMLLFRAGNVATRDTQTGTRFLSDIKSLKFDLVNIIDDRLILLELKNRVDSGGTAAREEALSKKFFTLSRLIESKEKVFVYARNEYDFAKLFQKLGINKIEMILGLLFNINGKEATINADRLHGFYSSSKTHMKNYLNELHDDVGDLKFDESKLSLSFKKHSVSVSIEMLYGDEVIQRFSSKNYDLTKLLEKAFSRSWDDIRLVFNITISQRAMLLKNRRNYMIQLKELKENDERFRTLLDALCSDSSDSKTLSNLVEYILYKLDSSDPSLPSSIKDNSYLADCLYAFASYIISKKYLVKAKKNMLYTKTDLNKGATSK